MSLAKFKHKYKMLKENAMAGLKWVDYLFDGLEEAYDHAYRTSRPRERKNLDIMVIASIWIDYCLDDFVNAVPTSDNVVFANFKEAVRRIMKDYNIRGEEADVFDAAKRMAEEFDEKFEQKKERHSMNEQFLKGDTVRYNGKLYVVKSVNGNELSLSSPIVKGSKATANAADVKLIKHKKNKSTMNEQYNVAGAIRKLQGRKVIVESLESRSEEVRDPFGFVIANGVALAGHDVRMELGRENATASAVAEQWIKEYYKKMKPSYRAGKNLTKEFKKWAKENPDDAAQIVALSIKRLASMGIAIDESDMEAAKEVVKKGL